MTCPAAHIQHDCNNPAAHRRAMLELLARTEHTDRRPVPLVWPSDPQWKGAAA